MIVARRGTPCRGRPERACRRGTAPPWSRERRSSGGRRRDEAGCGSKSRKSMPLSRASWSQRDRGAVELGMIDGRQARLARGGKKGVAIWHDAARDQDLTRDRLARHARYWRGVLPLPARLARPARGEDALRQPVAQIAVVDFGQPVQMRDSLARSSGSGHLPVQPTTTDGHGRAPLPTMVKARPTLR